MRVGLVTAMARPGRVLRTLAEAGVHPIRHVALADHALVLGPPPGVGVDLWLAPTKTRPLWRGRNAAWLAADPALTCDGLGARLDLAMADS